MQNHTFLHPDKESADPEELVPVFFPALGLKKKKLPGIGQLLFYYKNL